MNCSSRCPSERGGAAPLSESPAAAVRPTAAAEETGAAAAAAAAGGRFFLFHEVVHLRQPLDVRTGGGHRVSGVRLRGAR